MTSAVLLSLVRIPREGVEAGAGDDDGDVAIGQLAGEAIGGRLAESGGEQRPRLQPSDEVVVELRAQHHGGRRADHDQQHGHGGDGDEGQAAAQ